MSTATISAGQVKELREKTGAAMMDCKKALEATAGDMDAAVKWLREKGIAGAEKKAGRAAGEGLTGIKVDGSEGVIVELNCETDFVARTDKFLALLDHAVEAGMKQPVGPHEVSAEAALQVKAADGQTVEAHVKATIATLGENMALTRVARISVKQGVIGSYRHSDGKLSALVSVECGKAESLKNPEVLELAKDLAMQVAGNLPPAEVISREQISPELIAREKEIALTLANQQGAGKPANIIEKIAEGKLNKVLQEVTLLEQAFIKDTNIKIDGLLKQMGAKVGDTLSVGGFIRLKVGVR
jgi:elongation factor Ts